MTEYTVWKFSGWVVATRHSPRNPAHALYPIPRGDCFVDGLQEKVGILDSQRLAGEHWYSSPS